MSRKVSTRGHGTHAGTGGRGESEDSKDEGVLRPQQRRRVTTDAEDFAERNRLWRVGRLALPFIDQLAQPVTRMGLQQQLGAIPRLKNPMVAPDFTDLVIRRRFRPTTVRGIAKELVDKFGWKVDLDVSPARDEDSDDGFVSFSCERKEGDNTYTFTVDNQYVRAQPLFQKLTFVYNSPVWFHYKHRKSPASLNIYATPQPETYLATEDAIRDLEVMDDKQTTIHLHDVPENKIDEVVFALIVPVIQPGRVITHAIGDYVKKFDFQLGVFVPYSWGKMQ
jgi:hypothetical protein